MYELFETGKGSAVAAPTAPFSNSTADYPGIDNIEEEILVQRQHLLRELEEE